MLGRYVNNSSLICGTVDSLLAAGSAKVISSQGDEKTYLIMSLEDLYRRYLKQKAKSIGVHEKIVHIYVRLDGIRKKLIGGKWSDSYKNKLLFRLSSADSIEHNVGALSVEFPLETEWQYIRFRHAHPEQELFVDLIEEHETGDVFYDVGAYLGVHTVIANEIIDDGTIVAFEPHPASYGRFEQVVDWMDGDAILHNVALYDKQTTVEFSAEDNASARIGGSQWRPNPELIEIPAIQGDTLIEREGLAPPDILKIDAEQVESEVLEGFYDTIKEYKPRVIYCEIHGEDGWVGELLEELGYEYEDMETGRPVLKATPR